jgi:hypothetical protein
MTISAEDLLELLEEAYVPSSNHGEDSLDSKIEDGKVMLTVAGSFYAIGLDVAALRTGIERLAGAQRA